MLYAPSLNRFDGDSGWPKELRLRSRDVEADAEEGSDDGCGELIDAVWDSSRTPRTMGFLLVVLGLVAIVRCCGWPNAKPIAAIPTVPDAQSCSAGLVSTVTLRTAVRKIHRNSSCLHPHLQFPRQWFRVHWIHEARQAR